MMDQLSGGNSVNDRWCSHWRWRVVLLLLMGLLVGYGWILADQWRMRSVVAGSGCPAILSIYRRNGISIEAYDWKTGEHWHVTELKNVHHRNEIAGTLRAVGDGKSIAWQDGATIHVVDLAPPHEHRQYVTPANGTDDLFVGMTDDRRFAVFQSSGERVSNTGGGRVVDLKTGTVVDTLAWDSRITLIGPNQFVFLDGPATGIWRISADGKWEEEEDRYLRFAFGPSLSMTVDSQDRWRFLNHNLVAGSGQFVDRGETVLWADFRNDMRLIDTRTGNILSIDDRGSQRQFRLFVVAGLLLAVSAVLLGTAMRERHLFWTFADVFASFLAAQIGVGCILVGMVHPELFLNLPEDQVWVFPVEGYLVGMYAGATNMIGIYWAFGRGGLLWRWLEGGLCLLLTSLCGTVVGGQLSPMEVSQTMILGGIMAFGLILASATSCLGLLARTLGWTLGDVPVEENPRQYRLSSFFLIVAAIAVLIVLAQWLFASPNSVPIFFMWFGMVVVVGGAMLTGILLSGVKAWKVTIVAVLFVLLVAAWIYVHGAYRGILRHEIYLLYGPAALACAVTIAIPSLVLRSRGWHWR